MTGTLLILFGMLLMVAPQYVVTTANFEGIGQILRKVYPARAAPPPDMEDLISPLNSID